MSDNQSFARSVRLRRLYRDGNQRIFVVPLDHSVTDGPVTGGRRLSQLVGQLAGNGVDAVVLHKGSLRHVDYRSFTDTSLIVHLSASTRHAPDPDAKYLVGTVEECLRRGADAVSVHVNLGSDGERQQVTDLAVVAEACDRWNMPLLAMVYARGPRIEDAGDATLVAHAATLAADLGADIVKTVYVGAVDEMRDIVRSCPIPVIIAGGPRRDDTDAVLAYVGELLSSGAAGVAMGRNIFEAPDPGAMAARVASLIHQEAGPGLAARIPRLEVVGG
jgi:2-amino-4,5-dihydroxy-6-oxo-7-(phosphonooxy)heptanoate synthase